MNLPTLLPNSLAILMFLWSLLRIWPNRARLVPIDWGQNWAKRMPTDGCHSNTANKKTPTPRGQKYIDSVYYTIHNTHKRKANKNLETKKPKRIIAGREYKVHKYKYKNF